MLDHDNDSLHDNEEEGPYRRVGIVQRQSSPSTSTKILQNLNLQRARKAPGLGPGQHKGPGQLNFPSSGISFDEVIGEYQEATYITSL